MSYLEEVFFKKELQKIKNFSPLHATHYYDKDKVSCYFGVLLENGVINTEKYPSGRRNYHVDNEDEIFLY